MGEVDPQLLEVGDIYKEARKGTDQRGDVAEMPSWRLDAPAATMLSMLGCLWLRLLISTADNISSQWGRCTFDRSRLRLIIRKPQSQREGLPSTLIWQGR